ncbi:hypothetical protein STRTUCAR8_00017 [Streptomyces turgidiscabies Car8]|uniref:Uncharacterized protein n=1 Tax=Streptomyces turgidiscabies (strain Car8) TaxID=698760 RepID=L7FEY0_STRT8|nr:hypothetical protein STRTUCAR8_00017 [Streptomyces turgidiscabies Car8]
MERAVDRSLAIMRGGELYALGLCPVCGWSVSIRKRTDAVYCSKRCRTRAWRMRRRLIERGRDASERSSR